MKKYLKHVIITLAALSFLAILMTNSCGDTPEPYNPKSDKVKDSLFQIIDSIQREYDSALIKIDSIEIEKDSVSLLIDSRNEQYIIHEDKFNNYHSDSSYIFIVNFVDSSRRAKNLSVHFESDKGNSDSTKTQATP